MRIGIITISFPAISETFISNKVLQLSQRGHQVIVFCDGINKVLLNRLFGGNTSVKIVAITKMAVTKYAVSHPFKLLLGKDEERKEFKKFISTSARLHYINKYNLDIIHAEFSGIGALFLPVFKSVKAKTLVSCRGSAEKVKLLVSEQRRESIKQLFNQVDAIHCVSGDMKNTILPYCNNPSKIFINFPSIDAGLFKRSQPYTANNHIKILSVGRFTFQKGYLTGLLTIKKLKEHFQDFLWIIVGDGTQREEIIFHIHQMNLQHHVQLAGAQNREEIIALYNTADIFFLPSVYEGIANVALEAMSMELPVVSTRSGGMDEVITHNVDGMLAEVYDSDTLANHLLSTIGHFEKRKRLGTNARQRILEQFTIEKQTSIFEETYYNLLNKN